MTPSRDRNYLAAADLLRVFAVGLVAWFHIWQQSWLDPGFRLAGAYIDLQRIVRRGYMAVDLMLLLSGFLLYLPAARRARRGREQLRQQRLQSRGEHLHKRRGNPRAFGMQV